jgi:prepilin-type N-terminal cleavage/methylation domain-containing protein/prepilin-type processing-associated H-X9-DG protein
MISLRRRQSAFTLIELLSVIAIVAILAAILIPVVGIVRQKAALAGCKSNIRQVSMALLTYAQDHKRAFPPVVSDFKGRGYAWSNLLQNQGYITDTGVYRCPGDSLNTTESSCRSYAYCVTAMTGGLQAPAEAVTRLSVVQNASRQYMLTEWHDTGNQWQGPAWSGAAQDIISPTSVSPSHTDGGRHFSFMDGHVEWRTMDQCSSQWSGWVLNDIRE